MPTEAELAAGEAALKACVQAAEGWKAALVPQSAYVTGATDVIEAADSGKDQSATARQRAGQGALRSAIDSTGYGGEVTNRMCAVAAAAVLAAVATLRAAKSPTKEQT